MTVSTSQSQVTVYGNGITTAFNFPFIGVGASDILVTLNSSSGTSVVLSSSQYNLVINAPVAGQLWGVGGTVTYPTSGPALASGNSLLIQRVVPYTQGISITNQDNVYPQVTEQGLDLLEMQIQQVLARSTQFRGAWATGITYNIGDIVQDGSNGSNTNNFYICQLANTSGVWTTDLANGDWALSINVVAILASIGISAAMEPVVQASTLALARTLLGVPAVGDIAGGFVNKFRNPSFDIGQRGASGTVTTGNTNYTLDGWMIGATGATVSWTQPYGNEAANYYGSALRLQGATSMSDTLVKQRIESTIAAALAGQQVTVQFLIQATGTGTLSPTLTVKHATAQDNWGGTVTDVNAVALQTVAAGSTAVVSYTFTASTSSYNGLEITLDLGSYLNANTQFVNIANADVRNTPGITTGLNSAPPTVERRPFPVEFVFCQRYLPAANGTMGVTPTLGTLGAASSATQVSILVPFQVPARIIPTGISIGTISNIKIEDGVTAFTANALALNGGPPETSITQGSLSLGVASGLTQFRPYYAYFNSPDTILFTGAEL